MPPAMIQIQGGPSKAKVEAIQKSVHVNAENGGKKCVLANIGEHNGGKKIEAKMAGRSIGAFLPSC